MLHHIPYTVPASAAPGALRLTGTRCPKQPYSQAMVRYTSHPFPLLHPSLSFHASCPQSLQQGLPDSLLVRLLQVVRVHLLSKAEMGARLLTCKLTTTRPSGNYLSTRHNLGSAGKKSLNEGRQVGLCKSEGRQGLPSKGGTVLGSGA